MKLAVSLHRIARATGYGEQSDHSVLPSALDCCNHPKEVILCCVYTIFIILLYYWYTCAIKSRYTCIDNLLNHLQNCRSEYSISGVSYRAEHKNAVNTQAHAVHTATYTHLQLYLL